MGVINVLPSFVNTNMGWKEIVAHLVNKKCVRIFIQGRHVLVLCLLLMGVSGYCMGLPPFPLVWQMKVYMNL